MFKLLYNTNTAWLDAVMNDFNAFLLDHAAAEKKASGMAMSMLSHYPDRILLVQQMVEIAIEELAHFREVVKLLHQRNLTTGADEKDAYVNQLRQQFRKGSELYMLDRLILGGIIEARGYERFSMIAEALEAGVEKKFYQSIASSEAKHKDTFIELAKHYFDHQQVKERLDELLLIEAQITSELPIRAALH